MWPEGSFSVGVVDCWAMERVETPITRRARKRRRLRHFRSCGVVSQGECIGKRRVILRGGGRKRKARRACARLRNRQRIPPVGRNDKASGVSHPTSFSAEGVHGFDAGGAAGGDESGDRGEGGENQDCGADRQWIIDANAIELARHESAAEERNRDADRKAEAYLPRGGTKHQGDYVCAVSAEGHAQADLAGAARDGVSRNAIEAHRGKHEREHPE